MPLPIAPVVIPKAALLLAKAGAIGGKIVAGAKTLSRFAPIGMNWFGRGADAKIQLKMSKDLAAFQHAKNLELLNAQLKYNSPAEQMARFEAAGLNPNMVLSQGSAGNQSAPLSYPDMQAPRLAMFAGLENELADIQLKKAQARNISAQTSLTNSKRFTEISRKNLMEAQTAVAERNPLLNEDYVSSLVRSMEATAGLKETEYQTEASVITEMQGKKIGRFRMDAEPTISRYRAVAEMEKLMREFELQGSTMEQMKLTKEQIAETIKSQKFQNAWNELNKRFIMDGSLDGQTIRQALLYFLNTLSGGASKFIGNR